MEGPDKAGREHEEDEIWREIVARWDDALADDEDGDADAPWPPEENLDRNSTTIRVIKPADPHAVADGPEPEELIPADDEDDEPFVPPPAPPLPSLDPVAKAAWLALFGGPAYLLVTTAAGWTVPGWAAFAAVAAFVGGFITLVVRMSDEGRDDSGVGDESAD